MAWRYEIQYGPEGEANYAWVYDDSGNMVCVAKTHHAASIVETATLSARVAQLEEALDDMLFSYGDKYDSECRLKDAHELAVIARARALLSEKEARGC